MTKAYTDRIAFDVWLNDVRSEAALDGWPSPRFDDVTVQSIIRAMDVQSAAGYNIIDLVGFWATYSWSIDITSVADPECERRTRTILDAAHERGMKMTCFPSGICSWGFDEIIRHDSAVRGTNAHVMCPSK